ncbi:tRNA lysidine(34) synthetase TilS [Pedobacter sp.]|uniref:tRNA lysidine(34) synthetase TilS n=1 Tax=Pedobacter sp. TaxID=1411316 RepID=UPI003BADB590
MLPLQQFQDFIREHALFSEEHRILLAVSGGKDSVLMLHLFKALGFDFGVAHCNFNLRGAEAQRDEHFVEMLASSLDLPFHVTHFETKKYAREHKISTQMAARDLRYSWFEEIRLNHGYDFIALAQHQNDAVETLLINLTRGTGISGLHGILPKRDKLIRPLLFLNRFEIEVLISENQLDFVEDSSNANSDYTRNKIRHSVVPALQEINPRLEKTFAENISRFAEIELFLSREVERLSEALLEHKKGGIYLSLQRIGQLEPRQLLLFELLKPYGFTESVVAEILEHINAQSGKHFFSTSHEAIINRNELIIVAREDSIVQNQVIHPNTKQIEFLNGAISMSFSDAIRFDINAAKAYVDSDKLIFPLIVRTWQYGDRFIPLGMNGFKKISDFFIDEKLALHLKERIPVLVNGNGEIIWLAGMRQDNRYKLTGTTKKVAIFELKIN